MSPHTAAPVSTELADTADNLTGFGRHVQQIVDGLMGIATGTWTADETSTLLAVLGGGVGEDDIDSLKALVIQRLGDPATNPGLRELTPRRAREIRALTRQYAAYDRDFAPRDLLSEAAGAADIDCPHPTDH
ncbi:hypothetical protein [Streptomyces sp. NPDC093589]|uniref:hypothetical protein n=1 Tax=Streptomyces sp. NPDC093589 TaxID=3366043 RepID=UPI0037FCE513